MNRAALLRSRIPAMAAGLAFFTAFAVSTVSAADPPDRPNLILLFIDDMGYGDLGCYGSRLVPTPHIDRLAGEGVRFTDAYVTASVCAPSRCGIMTGAYNQRFGMQWNTDRQQYIIPETHKLLPETLRAAGYRTGLIGKWNLPRDPAAAFDETSSVMDWEGDYFPDEEGHYYGVDHPDQHASAKDQGKWGPERPGDEYLTDRLGRQAVDFITAGKGRPFFLYLAFNAVHTPLQAKVSDRERVAGIEPAPLRMYAAMVASLDDAVGRILDALRSAGLEENTLVALTSDNGPAMGPVKNWRDGWPTEVLLGSAGPLAGHKAQLHEGGIREPFILRWPTRLRGGQTFASPVSTMDLYATFCAASGTEVPAGTKLDGVDLLPYLEGEKSGLPHPVLFWKNDGNGAVRQGDWKLLIDPWKAEPQLFHLGRDIGETTDLADGNPEIAKQLLKAYEEWSAALPPPANPAARKKAAAPASVIEGAADGILSYRQPANREGATYHAYDVTPADGATPFTFSRMKAREGAPSVDIHSLVGHRVRVTGSYREGKPHRGFLTITGIEDLGE